jgi:hypothetical protein
MFAMQALADIIRRNWAQSADALADTASNSHLAPNGTNSSDSNWYQTDHRHGTLGTNTTAAMYGARAFNALYGSTVNNCDANTVAATPYQMLDRDGCKVFDTQAGASVYNLESALGQYGRTIRACNQPSGAGANLTVNVATVTPTSNSTGVVSSQAIPIAEYIGQSGTTSITVAVNTCKTLQAGTQSSLTGGGYWRVIQ